MKDGGEEPVGRTVGKNELIGVREEGGSLVCSQERDDSEDLGVLEGSGCV